MVSALSVQAVFCLSMIGLGANLNAYRLLIRTLAKDLDMKFHWTWACAVATYSFAVSMPFALAKEESVKDDARKAGQAVGSAAREVWKGTKKAGKEIGHGAKKVGKTVGGAAKEGGKEIKRAVNGEK